MRASRRACALLSRRSQYFFFACPILGDTGAIIKKDGSTIECSDAKFDCPNLVHLGYRWWEYMGGITFHASNVTTNTSYTAPLTTFTFDPTGDGTQNVELSLLNRTVHVVVPVSPTPARRANAPPP